MGRLDDTQADGRLILLAGDVLTMLLLTAGCALAFLSGYGIVVDYGAVTAFCVFAAAVSVALHKASQPWGALLALAGLMGLYWYNWEEFLPVFRWIGQMMNLLPSFTGLSPSQLAPDKEKLLPVILLLCASLAWVMGWTVVRARRWYLAALLSVALLVPALQMGVLPAWGAMMMNFAGWGSMLLTSLYGRKDAGGLGRAQLLNLAGMCGLILLLVMSLPMEGYTRPQWATDARTNLIRGVTARLERFFDLDELNDGIFADLGIDLSLPDEGTGSVGAVVSGGATVSAGSAVAIREDLLAAGPRRYANRRFLSVQTNQPGGGRVYLRGASMGRYTGEAWEWESSGQPPFFSEPYPDARPSVYPAETAGDAPVYTMTIRDIAYRGSSFYPYRLIAGYGVTDEAGRITLPWEMEWDNNPTLTGEEQYAIGYCPGGPEDGFAPLTGELAVEELRYREEVVPQYLEVPPELEETLSELLSGEATAELWDDPDTLARYETVIAAAQRTAELLEERAVYDPDTPAMRPEEDFVEHFLEEGRGYCVHFATAGALLLRCQGVPARYVTGYVANLNDQGRGTVFDSDAHAWVEVYIDGYGWHPVEMTPGYSGGESGVELEGAPEDEPPEDGDESEETPEDVFSPEDQDELADGDQSEDELPGEEAAPEERISVWKILGGVTLALTALGSAYALSFLPGKLARRDPDANRSVIHAYRRYSRLRRWGGSEDETLEELGRKAKFSQHTLTEEEREAAWSSLDASVTQTRKRQRGWKKLAFPLLKPLF